MAKEKSVTIQLEFPVELADRTLNEITIRRPTLGDLEDYPVNVTSGLKEERALVAYLCDLHPDDLRPLDSEDYGKLQKLLLQFRGIPLSQGYKA